MNRYPMVFAKRHWSPSLNPWIVRLMQPFRNHRYREILKLNPVQVEGQENLRDALATGHRVLITPNHPSHADPFAVYEACHSAGTYCHIMAAWHVFAKHSPWMRHCLQWHGCFSIDREANDLVAFRTAIDTLRKRSEPLVIFPEGDIYHCNDRVTPFREGAFAIACAAARRTQQPVVVLPTAIRYRCATDPLPGILDVLARVEEQLLWRPKTDKPLLARIQGIGHALMSLKEQEYLGHASSGHLPRRIERLSSHILKSLELRYELSKAATVPKRVKAIRQRILTMLSDADLPDTTREELRVDLDDAFLALQLFSYPGDYLEGSQVSIERVAETVDKLEEDVLRVKTAGIRCRRDVTVSFGEPIAVPVGKSRKDAHRLSDQAQTAVERLLARSAVPHSSNAQNLNAAQPA
ncbi:MAG: 1-acyl-sn-glycerol-3-phosphate acyltransferase [bacterium]|nr:1-acyl-sn-glycerol-3-phosphate acyltransferase [bacterium]